MSSLSETSRAGFRAVVLAISVGVIVIVILASSPDKTFGGRVLAASAPPGYSSDVAPILKKNCIICHSHAAHKSGLVMDSYEALMKGGTHGASIVPHDATGSRLVAMLEGGVKPRMPLDDDPLPASDIAIIKEWINAGAIGPATNETTVPVAVPTTPDIRP